MTVVIPTHNRLAGLAQLLGDLADQRLDGVALDVVVVDSPAASEDSGPVVATAHSGGLQVRRVVGRNVVAAKRNLGAQTSHADLLVFLDDDMRVGPDFVGNHVRAHAELKNVVVSGAVAFPGEQVLASNYYRFKAGRHMLDGGVVAEGVPAHRLVSMNLSVLRSDYLAVGGMDEEFVFYGAEDLELGYRCEKEGLKLAYAPFAPAEHHEVQMSPNRYLHKVYTAAYRGFPRLLAQHPEARSITTVQLTHRAYAAGLFRLVSLLISVLAQPWLMRGCGAWLDATDQKAWLYSPLVFKVATIMANALAAKDVGAGRECRDIRWRVAG